VPAFHNRTKRDAVVAIVRAARQQQMLRVLAIHQHADGGRLSAFLTPSTIRTRRVHDGNGLAVGRRLKRLLESRFLRHVRDADEHRKNPHADPHLCPHFSNAREALLRPSPFALRPSPFGPRSSVLTADATG